MLHYCTIYIYDSIRSAAHDKFVIREVKKYAELIPTYLATEDFYEATFFESTLHKLVEICVLYIQ